MRGKKQSWLRRVGESMPAYTLFLAYLEIGPDRTLQKVAEKTGRLLSTVASVSADYNWNKRAREYDEYILQVQLRAMENTLQKEAVLRAKRRAKFLDEEYEMAGTLLAKIKEMVAWPIAETLVTKVENVGGHEVATQVIMKPMKWGFKDIETAFKTISQVMRLHLEMETSRDTVVIDLKNDPERRLQMARTTLAKFQANIEQYVDALLLRDPDADRAQVLATVEEEMYHWASEDWQVDVEDLLPLEPPLLTTSTLEN